MICQPLYCGLNDILCQIGKCIKYCLEHNRKLIIDTKRFSGMKRDFSDYFIIKDPINESFIQLSLSDDELLSLSTQSKLKKQVDFSKSYEEEVIIHREWGGGTMSRYALSFLKFQPNLAKSIQHKLNLMPDDYCSVYVRNTDLKTNYEELFERIKSEIDDKYLLICTDDYRVIEYAKGIFSKLLFDEDIVKNEIPSEPLMSMLPNNFDNTKVNIDAITDLILGASAIQVFPTFVSAFSNNKPVPKNFQSGYMLLGIYLNQNKHVIRELLST